MLVRMNINHSITLKFTVFPSFIVDVIDWKSLLVSVTVLAPSVESAQLCSYEVANYNFVFDVSVAVEA